MDWLSEFTLIQPSKFFKDYPTNDTDLVCTIQTEKEFFLSSLEFFGLPVGFIEGKGHFPNWGKDQKNDKSAAAKKK